MTPISQAEALRAQNAEKAYRKAMDARDAVAWRAPGVSRFDSRPANDTGVSEPTLKEIMSDLPPWVTTLPAPLSPRRWARCWAAHSTSRRQPSSKARIGAQLGRWAGQGPMAFRAAWWMGAL